MVEVELVVVRLFPVAVRNERRPVFEIEKRVVVAEAVEEPIAKSVVLVEPLLAWIENLAHGDEEATPSVP